MKAVMICVALFASAQAQYKIHATRYRGLTCHGTVDANETHIAKECFAAGSIIPSSGGYRLWSCGHPCREGICLSEGVYDDANCTKMTDTSPFPNPNFVPTEKCEEQALLNHFKIHCEGP